MKKLTLLLLLGAGGCVYQFTKKSPASGPTPGSPTVIPPTPTSPERKILEEGIISFYGPGFHGRKTANGETFNQEAMTCAHKTLSFGTMIDVVDLDTGNTVRVRVNDRGPFVKGRVVDLSVGAARKLGILQKGLAKNGRVLAVPAGQT